ncbi:MAG: NAD(P)/FAD-dependent oxidoreductase, partial [Minisyncoccia bacterium]
NEELIHQFHPNLRKKALNYLLKNNIKIIFKSSAKEISKNFILLDNNQKINTSTVIWTAGVKPNLPKILGDVFYEKERIIVNKFLQIKNYFNVFAIGDCAYILDKNNILAPQLAQSAVLEARNVALNIKNLIKNKSLKEFEFKPSGYLVSLGKLYAIGQIYNFTISGFWVWILWRMVYLFKMISWRNKIKTFVDWLIDLFLLRNSAEI